MNKSVGMGRSSRHVIAIGRSPVWLTYVAGPKNMYGEVPNSSFCSWRTNNRTVLLPDRYRWPVAELTDVVDCDSQWNRVGLIG